MDPLKILNPEPPNVAFLLAAAERILELKANDEEGDAARYLQPVTRISKSLRKVLDETEKLLPEGVYFYLANENVDRRLFKIKVRGEKRPRWAFALVTFPRPALKSGGPNVA